ncbi:MAG TPA: nucleotide exchange factor GrpE, partial [Rectinemataceae bacterium]|nr:nucleotide exchange factor GrpE [Rectinemataceae bacterium]
MSNKHHDRPAPAGAGETSTPRASIPPEGDRSAQSEGAPEGATLPGSEELDALRSRVKDLEDEAKRRSDEASTLKDQYLRSLADYENFRKRMFREREDQQKYANFGLLSDLVPLLDDFDRAIASAEHSRDYQTLHDGIAI